MVQTADATERGQLGGLRQANLWQLGAVALGVMVPILVLGRTALAIAAAIGILGLATAVPRSRLFAEIKAALRTPLAFAVMVTLGLWLVSVAGSVRIGNSIPVWVRMIALLVVGIGLTAVLRQRRDLHTLTLKAVMIAAPVCILAGLFAIYVVPDSYAWLTGHGNQLQLSNLAPLIMKSYGTAVACLMPVTLWSGWRLGGRWRWPAVAFQVLALVLLATLQDRAGLIAGAMGLGVFAGWLALRYRKGWLLLLLVPMVLAVVAGAFLDNQRHNGIQPALGLPSWLVDDHRQTIWAFALHYVPGEPTFGYGLDVIDLLPGAHDMIPGTNVAYIPSHPHDFAIEVLVETGPIGAAALACVLVLLAAGMVRAARREGAPGVALLGLSAAFWFPCLVSYSFWSYWWQATYVVLLAVIAATLTPGLLSDGFGLMKRREAAE